MQAHAAVQGSIRVDGRVIRLVSGVVKARGNKKAMLRMVKDNGGNKAGWFLYFTGKPVGASIDG